MQAAAQTEVEVPKEKEKKKVAGNGKGKGPKHTSNNIVVFGGSFTSSTSAPVCEGLKRV